MQMYNFFRNRKSQPCTSCIGKPGFVQTVEFFKYACKLLRLNCLSMIFKDNPNTVSLLLCFYCNLCLWVAVCCRIFQEITKNPRQFFRVGIYG